MVNFKVGYSVGQPIEYDHKNEDLNGEITYLNKHFTYVDKRALMLILFKIYMLVAVVIILFNQKNILIWNYQAPFQLSTMTPAECGKVYSSHIGNEELFDFIVTDIKEDDDTSYQLLSIYTRDYYYLFKMIEVGSYEIQSEEPLFGI